MSYDRQTNTLRSMYYVDDKLNIHHVYVHNSWVYDKTKDGYKLYWIITKAYQHQQLISWHTGKAKGKYIEDTNVISEYA